MIAHNCENRIHCRLHRAIEQVSHTITITILFRSHVKTFRNSTYIIIVCRSIAILIQLQTTFYLHSTTIIISITSMSQIDRSATARGEETITSIHTSSIIVLMNHNMLIYHFNEQLTFCCTIVIIRIGIIQNVIGQ